MATSSCVSELTAALKRMSKVCDVYIYAFRHYLDKEFNSARLSYISVDA